MKSAHIILLLSFFSSSLFPQYILSIRHQQLRHAVIAGSLEWIEFWLEQKADPTVQDKYGNSLVELINPMHPQKETIIALLQKYGTAT